LRIEGGKGGGSFPQGEKEEGNVPSTIPEEKKECKASLLKEKRKLPADAEEERGKVSSPKKVFPQLRNQRRGGK